jgi:S-adenosylmethionine-dependent methyltransferase
MKEQNNFDKCADQWSTTRELPWNRLRYELTNEFIISAIEDIPKSILNIGCGDGIESYLFDAPNVQHTLIDISAEMIEKAKHLNSKLNASGNFTYIHGDVSELGSLTQNEYDLILLHNVLEYTENPEILIKDVRELLAHNGLLSVRHLNRFSNPYIATYMSNDIDLAVEQLDSSSMESSFGMRIKTYSGQEMIDMLERSGLHVSKYFGLISLCNNFLDNDLKYKKDVFKRLKRLERKMAKSYPHFLVSRFGLMLCRIHG